MRRGRGVCLAGIAAAAAVLACALPAAAGARTITVDTLDGGAVVDGNCALPEAITAANEDAPEDDCRRGDGADTIAFDIAAPGSVISPATALPPITERVVLDGSSEPDPGNDRMTLDGDSAGAASGITVQAGRTTIRGFVVIDFALDGISITGGRNKIIDCRVGTSGLASSAGNGNQGIEVAGNRNRIGGGTPATGNLVSANTQEGVLVSGTGNIIRNNIVGTFFNGVGDIGNGLDGIEVDGEENVVGPDNVVSGNQSRGIMLSAGRGHIVRGNIVGLSSDGESEIGNEFAGIRSDARRGVIGGGRPSDRNVISGNGGDGITLLGTGENPARMLIQGNYVGIDADGNEPMGNAEFGINVDSSSRNTIGGPEAGAGNVIAGNGGGVIIDAFPNPAVRNRVVGNLIGTDPGGAATAGFGNSGFGGFGVGIVSGASDNTIGGTTRGAGNVIAGNGQDGVFVSEDTSLRNSILRNSIFANGGLGIDLGGDGVTENDFGMLPPHDTDFGPNALLNFPEITELGPAAGRIAFSLRTAPNTRFRVEAFASDTPDPSDHGEGQRFIGAMVVRTNASGVAQGVLRDDNPQADPVALTATRLGADGDPRETSEFGRAEQDQ